MVTTQLEKNGHEVVSLYVKLPFLKELPRRPTLESARAHTKAFKSLHSSSLLTAARRLPKIITHLSRTMLE
jgi:hypothetical protein